MWFCQYSPGAAKTISANFGTINVLSLSMRAFRCDRGSDDRRFQRRSRACADRENERLEGEQVVGRSVEDFKGAGIAVRTSNVQALFTGDMQLEYSYTAIKKNLAWCREPL
ncbi:hypothetical protein BURKHO8Y_60051 [Burkholderia sp. 8Y]|nr:hypothetical protein BURKHO8Y_60051 [Burkholderia sp. 8Y]